MALKIIEKDHFTYVMYKRESHSDFITLRVTVNKLLQGKDLTGNVAMDLTFTASLTNGEIWQFVALVKGLSESRRAVWFIAQNPTAQQLLDLNLTRFELVEIFQSHTAFLEHLNRPT